MASPLLTVGVEEEYMVLAPQNGALVAGGKDVIAKNQAGSGVELKPEAHEATVEAASKVCRTIAELHEEVVGMRRQAWHAAEQAGCALGAAGTHPCGEWTTQLLSKEPWYEKFVDHYQDAARRNLVYGLHVHVGIESKKQAMWVFNTARHFLPYIYALSVNSPFWEGRNSGYQSYRSRVYAQLPRTGIPPFFESFEAYASHCKRLSQTKLIAHPKHIWWDIRLSPQHKTVEFRICDMPLTAAETVTIAALIQAVCLKICQTQGRIPNFFPYNVTEPSHHEWISEYKWQISRYGLSGPAAGPAVLAAILDYVEAAATELGSQHYLAAVETLLVAGTGADKQLKVYAEMGDLQQVSKYVSQQFLA